MKIQYEIIIDDKLTALCRKVFTVKMGIFFIAVILFATGLFLFSDPITKPYTFVSNDVISSAEVNENFDMLYTKVNELDLRVKELGNYWTQSGSDIYYNNGNVGIGTTSPVQQLHIKSNSGLMLENTSGYYRRIYTDPDGDLLFHSGNNYAYLSSGGVWINASSIEYKQDIRPIQLQEALDTLVGLNPVKYAFKVTPDVTHIGFIAEEVPEMVATKDRKGLSSMDIVAILTKIVQQQQKEIEALKAKFNNGHCGYRHNKPYW